MGHSTGCGQAATEDDGVWVVDGVLLVERQALGEWRTLELDAEQSE